MQISLFELSAEIVEEFWNDFGHGTGTVICVFRIMKIALWEKYVHAGGCE